MAAKAVKTKPQVRKKLKEIATSRSPLTVRQLRSLEEIAEVLGKSFAQEVAELGLLETAVEVGHDGIVDFLLERGVDPNALPKKATSAARALGRPFANFSRLQDEQRVSLCTRMLQAGADPNDVYPSPKNVKYSGPAWGQRFSALDLALLKRSEAVSVLLAADLTEVTRVSATSVAVYASGIAGDQLRLRRDRRADRPRGLPLRRQEPAS